MSKVRLWIYGGVIFFAVSVYSQINSDDLNSGLRLNHEKKYNEAILLFNKILKGDPHHLVALQGIGLSLLELKEYDQSLQYLERARLLDNNNITTLSLMARLYEAKGISYKSHYYYRRVHLLDPYFLEAYLGRARIFTKDRHYHSAIEMYNKVLSVDPYHEGALVGLSSVYQHMDEAEMALQIEKKHIEIKPRDSDAILRIAALHERRGEAQTAIEWYEKAQKINPKNEMVLTKLSLLYANVNQIDNSLLALQKATELQGRDIKAFVTLGRSYAWTDRMEKAIKAFERGRELDPKNISILTELANVYLLNGEWDRAKKLYHEALAIDPKHKEALEGLSKTKADARPILTSRVNYKTRKDRISGSSGTERIRYELSQEMEWSIDSTNRITLGYQNNHHYQTDRGTQLKDYNYDQEIGFLKYRLKLDEQLILSTQGDYNFFNNKGTNTFNFKKDELHRFSAFSYLLYTHENFYMFAAVQRDHLLRLLNPNVLVEDPYHDYSWTGGINFSDYLETKLYYSFTDFTKGVHDQHDIDVGFTYRLPFLTQMEMGYSFEYIGNPPSRIHTPSLRFQDNIGKGILTDFLYEYILDNNKNDQGRTYKHFLKGIVSVPIYQKLALNFDGRYLYEFGNDHDSEREFRVFLTLPLGIF